MGGSDLCVRRGCRGSLRQVLRVRALVQSFGAIAQKIGGCANQAREAHAMSVAAMAAMFVIDFTIRRTTLMRINLMTKFFLMGGVVTMQEGIGNNVGRGFQAREDE